MDWKQNRFGMVLIFSLVLVGCVGKIHNADGGGDGTQTGTPSAGAAVASIGYAIAGLNIGVLGLTHNKPAVASPEQAGPVEIRNSVYRFLEDLRELNGLTVSPSNDLSDSICEGGGSAVATTGIDASTSDYKITVQFDQCRIPSQAATINLVLEMVFPDTPSLPIAVSVCDGLSVKLKENGTRSISGVDFDNSITFSDYQASLTTHGCDSDGIPDNFSLLASGSASYTDNLSDQNSVDVKDIILSVLSTPTVGGPNLSLDGSFSVTTACFSGSVGVDTNTAISYGFGLGGCPTSGLLTVTGTVPGTVSFAENGEVTVVDGTKTTIVDACQELVACL
jgi:hypothetical protein